ncbi:hypothetical protein LR48_Vigan04g089700 [Vigna angularis]|uniref:Uncharacterized protein n=1 Tax=Phaseolus angularis TaxID=3914 RepID=A0A0L9UDU3_PHAAN|nr:hypothetical protein LR48_Vigan04g089700 [Vigna angularis]
MGDVRTDLPRVAAVWCIPVTTSLGCKDACNYTDSYSPDEGGASLEQMLEEENLDETNLVEVDVKAEP